MKTYLKIFTYLALTSSIANPNVLNAQSDIRFPYEIDLTQGQPDGVVKTSGSGTNVAVFNTDGLLLTPPTEYQFGGVLFDAISFNSTNGLTIEFEYSIYEGTEYIETLSDPNSYRSFGDGLSLFLYDGNIAKPVLGARGRGLGYAYNYATNSNAKQGLSGAYLGVGIDVFGNFKGNSVTGNPQEYLNGIVKRSTGEGAINGEWSNYGSSHVTLRGAYDRTIRNGTSDYYSGYPVLATQSTLGFRRPNGLSTSVNLYAGAALTNNNSATYATNSNYLTNPFNLRGGVKNPPVTSTAYRKAFITILPAPAITSGFYITVKIQAGNATPVTVIDKFLYRESLVYRDNGRASGSQTYTLNSAIPNSFKIGFAASTGGASEAHLIKMVKVSLPYLPVTQVDNGSFCSNYTSSYEIGPFDNDIFYNGLLSGLTEPSPGNTNLIHIDYNTFRFEDSNGVVKGSTQSLPSYTATYTEPNVGTWIYSGLTGKVSFTPVNGYTGPAEIYYSAKGPLLSGMPYNQEYYRSPATKISLNVVRCGSVINPHIPSGGVSRSGR